LALLGLETEGEGATPPELLDELLLLLEDELEELDELELEDELELLEELEELEELLDAATHLTTA
jgi:hypothetical protein